MDTANVPFYEGGDLKKLLVSNPRREKKILRNLDIGMHKHSLT